MGKQDLLKITKKKYSKSKINQTKRINWNPIFYFFSI